MARTSVAILLAALVLVTGIFPVQRCTPAGEAGHGLVVLVGSHAHEGCEGHRGLSHDSDGDDEEGSDHDRCCVDQPADPVAPPARAGSAAPAAMAAAAAFSHFAEPPPSAIAPHSSGHVPIPRRSTETVVLLR